ncbi:MAG: alpha/beta hydrolase [Clostridiaceae bacterium]|nr:alpha/beta hydrolase [Clostridiaceae bacterium]
MNKKLKNALAATGAIAVTAAAVYGLNVLDERKDRKRYPQSGRMVEVRGRKMHIYTCGSGTNTIVMIAGQGTPTPSLDFKPLLQRLSPKYRIAVPEPFGYGYSDKTAEPRTVQNIVGEMREGLRKAGVFPPYVLMGHALGGIATLYWASHYPREVAAVVGIDTTLPSQGRDFVKAAILKPVLKTASFLTKITPIRFLIKSGLMDASLTAFTGGQEDNLPIVRSHTANIKTSGVYANELFAIPQNCAEVLALNYPASCPVLMFVSSESSDLIKSHPSFSVDWISEHEKIAMHSQRGKCVLLEGGHYLHHTASDAIAAEMIAFIPPEECQTPHLRKFLSRK